MASTLMVVLSVPASIPACGSNAGSSGGAVFAAARSVGNGRGSYVWPCAIDALNRPTLSAITEALSIRTPVGRVTEYNHQHLSGGTSGFSLLGRSSASEYQSSG